MKTYPAAYQARLEAHDGTSATLWHITRRDGQIFRFTDLDQDLVVNGQTFSAAGGYTASNIETSAELSVDNMEIQGFLDSALITDEDIAAGLWDHAAVHVGYVDWEHPELGIDWQRSGWLGEVTTADTQYTSELRGLTQPLQQNIGKVFAATCWATLGDNQCKINLASYTFTASVATVASYRAFAAPALTQAAEYFSYGLLTWTSGANANLSMEVKDYGVGAVVLQLPMPYPIQVGDTFQIVAGCGKRLQEDCKTKFNNVINFRGFPYIPGSDQIMRGPN